MTTFFAKSPLVGILLEVLRIEFDFLVGYVTFPVSAEMNHFEMRMGVRTDLQSGLLFVFTGNASYIFGQIQDGELYFEMGYQGSMTSLIIPTASNVNVCDGNWYNIYFIKNGKKLTVKIYKTFRVRTSTKPLLEMDNSGDETVEVLLLFLGYIFMGGIKENTVAYDKAIQHDFYKRLVPGKSR